MKTLSTPISNTLPWDHLWTNVHLATLAKSDDQHLVNPSVECTPTNHQNDPLNFNQHINQPPTSHLSPLTSIRPVGRIATSDVPYGALRDAAIGVKDGKIVWLGTMADLPDQPERLASHVTKMNGEWVTPGLIDCHTHLVYGGQRAEEFARKLQGESYESIAASGGGILSSVNATRAASFDELLSSAMKRALFAMEQGVTTLEIKSGYGLDQETELKILRVAKRLGELLPITIHATCLAAHAIPPEYKTRRSDYVSWIIEELLPEVKKEDLASAVDVFCEKIAFSLEETELIFKAAQELGFSIKIHAEQLSSMGGTSLAARYQALSADHLEYVTESDVLALKDSGTVAVLLPGAFYFLRETQKPPFDLFRKHHVPIALATDFNPGTSPINSLPSIMNLACVLWRFTPEEALRGVTLHAAKALGLDAEIGSLEIGKNADFAFWQIETLAELAYYLNGCRCSGLVKNGIRINVRSN
ncbi:MAG TPA: imidazolonepropionase [Chthoniobacterales bacterium]|nr:imidazolonepropionase [Chthoniobacterales bacterium]